MLGPVNIGDGAKIAAGAVVVRDVPAGAMAAGVPAKILNGDRTVPLGPGEEMNVRPQEGEELPSACRQITDKNVCSTR